MSNHPKNIYYPHIDGLRAIAVIAVIFYHADFKINNEKILSGGFLGVDIFFVISGYIITKLLYNEYKRTGDIDFSDFYNRRARRILPALFFVLISTFIFAYLLFTPNDLVNYSKSAISSISFISNIFFYINSTVYGAIDSQLNPLLHTWSLSIEEQYYIIAPIILLLVIRKKYLVKPAYLIVIVCSFLYAMYLSNVNSSLSFYHPLTRVWEILLGGMIVFLPIQEFRKIKLPIQNISLVLIILIFLLAGNENNHPGLVTLLACISAAAIIIYGGQPDESNKLLQSRVMVHIGKLSYSLYLIHFPIFSISLYIYDSLEFPKKILIILMCYVAALFTYKNIETPFRLKNKFLTKKVISLFVISYFLLLSANLYVLQNDGMLNKSSVADNKMIQDRQAYWDNWDFYNPKNNLIRFEEHKKTNILVIGNSWAFDIAKSLSMNPNFVVQFEEFTGHKCIAFTIPNIKENSREYNEWKSKCAQNYKKFTNVPNGTNLIVLADNVFKENEYSNHVVENEFSKHIDNLRQQNHENILVIKGRPKWKKSIRNNLIKNPDYDLYGNKQIQKYLKSSHEDMKETEDYYKNYYSKKGLHYISLIDALCDNKVCVLHNNKNMLYHDSSHLSIYGAHHIQDYLSSMISKFR